AGNTRELLNRETKMKSTSKMFAASAATLLTSVFFVMTAPAAHADDYCITNGAQAAHGCGYPTMETCRAAASGIGGTCAQAASSKNPNEALNYQQGKSNSRKATRKNEATGN